MVTTLSEENEEYLRCQESLAIDIDEGGLAEQEANQSSEEEKPGAQPRDGEETREVEDTWL